MSLTKTLLALAAFFLILTPALWVFGAWDDPFYQIYGVVALGGCVTLGIWSVRSHLTSCRNVNDAHLLCLLGGMVVSRMLEILYIMPSLHALTLTLAVLGLAYGNRLHQRIRRISPIWLAAAVACALPVSELGEGLQWLYVNAACYVLAATVNAVSCHGFYIMQDGQDMLVGIPYYHSAMCMLPLGWYCLLASAHRLSLRSGVTGLTCVCVIMLLLSALHIMTMATATDRLAPEAVHWMIMLMSCGVAYLWVVAFHMPVKRTHPVLDHIRYGMSPALQRDGWWLQSAPPRRDATSLLLACCFLACAFMLTALPLHEDTTPIQIAAY